MSFSHGLAPLLSLPKQQVHAKEPVRESEALETRPQDRGSLRPQMTEAEPSQLPADLYVNENTVSPQNYVTWKSW